MSEKSTTQQGESQKPAPPNPANVSDKGDKDGKDNGGYQVLARKYRPRNFDDLIGQEAMVQTLSNAFATGRIAHAFMLTGVRGVGKTTTARILARAFNYVTDTVDEPTIAMNKMGAHCESIMAGNHVDIIEMDAASRTGIGDVREIIDNVRYKPASARYKIYIIDEVHMLSTQAFNGLLKTLEEPPEHVKFIFATTEIRKIPVTVLSRCQRFDLRRLDQEETLKLLGKICKAEKVQPDEECLALIARAAEGSARDALSLLDRALAHGGQAGVDKLSAEDIRNMLGLADRARVFDLFDFLMQGDIAKALEEFDTQCRMGADPAMILADLVALTHWLTRLKYVAGAVKDVTMSETQRARGMEVAKVLSVRVLSRTWQVLLKGHSETLTAPQPMAAAEMVLVRLAHLADMPPPEELLKQWEQSPADAPPAGAGGKAGAGAPSASGAVTQARGGAQSAVQPAPLMQTASVPEVQIGDFNQLVAFVGAQRDIRLKHALESGAHLVRFEPATGDKGGVIEIRLADGQEDFARSLTSKLRQWTGQKWMVSLSQEEGAPTLKEQNQSQADARRDAAAQDPIVKEALKIFSNAEIARVTDLDGDFDETGEGAGETLSDDAPDDAPDNHSETDA